MVETGAITAGRARQGARPDAQGLEDRAHRAGAVLRRLAGRPDRARSSARRSRTWSSRPRSTCPCEIAAGDGARKTVAAATPSRASARPRVVAAGRRGPGAGHGRRRRLRRRAPINRAVDAHRQAGSAWKPFVYLTAMEAGRTPRHHGGRRAGDHQRLVAAQLRAGVPGPDHPGDRRWPSRSTPSPRGWPTRWAAPNVAATAQRAGHRLADQHRPGHGARHHAGHAAGDGPGLRRLRQRRLPRRRLWHRAHPHGGRPGALPAQARRPPAPAIANPPLGEMQPDAAHGDGLGHRRRAPRSRATTWPARPAPPRTTRTPGSAASPAASRPWSGWAATTPRR